MSDGKDLLRRVEQLLDEESTGTWVDDRTTYDFLYEGAKEWAARTACLTGTYHFKTVANQANYVLPADFLQMYVKDKNDKTGEVGARVSYHARRWYVHVASAFPLDHHYRAVLAWSSS